MRLFVAVTFDRSVKDKLYSVIDNLKQNAVKGNFTAKENLHLTLVFLGEVKNTEKVKFVINNIKSNKFIIKTDTIGKFRRGGGDIYWVGLKESKELLHLYIQLSKELINMGFDIDKKVFKPHITMGRELLFKNEPEINIPEIEQQVCKISLMKSERINGKLTYTEIYAKPL